jgi:hypothetical protein
MIIKTGLVICWSNICSDVILEYLLKMQVFWDMARCSLAVQEVDVLDLEDGDRKLLCDIAVCH